MDGDNLKVYETPKRSLLKAISFRAIEIGIDTGLIFLAFSHIETIMGVTGLSYGQVAFILAVLLETVCLVLHFAFERIWNKIDYGRMIVVKKDECDT